MYLAFKHLQIGSKKGQQWPESQKQSTNYFFEVKMQRDRCR